MQTKETSNILVSLDIGTSKVACLVAELQHDGRLDVIGVGYQPCKGLKKGVVTNIEQTVVAIERAVEEAELMADCKIANVYTGLSGSHVKSFNSQGMVALKDKEVTTLDMSRVVDTAKAVNIPTDQQIIHVLEQDYVIDGQNDVKDPLGMSGVRLEVKVHMVSCAVSAAQNITKCVERAGLKMEALALNPLASAEACVSEDEKDLGVCVVDIGAGTTDITIYYQGSVRHTAVIPIAGDQITGDIAAAFRTPTKEAEDLKRSYGCALAAMADPKATVALHSVTGGGSSGLAVQALANVIEPRIEELFSFILQELQRSGFEQMLSSGVVLTGGSSVLKGMAELAEEVLHLPVRVGAAKYSGGLAENVCAPKFSTAVGLLMMHKAHYQKQQFERLQASSIGDLWHRFKSWWKESFV